MASSKPRRLETKIGESSLNRIQAPVDHLSLYGYSVLADCVKPCSRVESEGLYYSYEYFGISVDLDSVSNTIDSSSQRTLCYDIGRCSTVAR